MLGQTIFDRALQIRGGKSVYERETRLRESIAVFKRTLELDSENVDAHYNLSQLYSHLGEMSAAKEHQKLHAKYKPDDTAKGLAFGAARSRYPAANEAAERVVVYKLNRTDEQIVDE